MIPNLNINNILLEQAVLMGGLKTKNETVNLALKEFIEKRAKEDAISFEYSVEIAGKNMSEKKNVCKHFAKTRGMWKDYDIDAKQLRRDAWGIEKNYVYSQFETV